MTSVNGMKNIGFGLFQSVLALLIISTALIFILDMTIHSLHANNEIEQSIQHSNDLHNAFEILLAKKNK